MVRVSCVYVKSLLYALFIMLVLYAAWLSLLCNLDFSCFKSLYYVPVTLVVLVCCSLPLNLQTLVSHYLLSILLHELCLQQRERERAFEIHVNDLYRHIVSRLLSAYIRTPHQHDELRSSLQTLNVQNC